MLKGALNSLSHKFIMEITKVISTVEITRVIASALAKMAFTCGHGFSD